MAEVSSTYQSNIGIEQGGSTLFAKSGTNFKFYDTDFTADKLRHFMLSFQTKVAYLSAATSVLSTSIMAYPYGHHIFQLGPNASKASFVLHQSADSGCIVWLNARHLTTDANISIRLSGNSLINEYSTELSSFELSAAGYVKLICTRAGQWSIVEGNINEHAAA